MMLNDISGKRFGRLVVLGRDYTHGKHDTWWECKCDCGNITYVRYTSLNKGLTKSCGCLNKDGTSKHNYKHGKTKLYRLWQYMKTRCLNKNSSKYSYYGGRGIKICDEWIDDYDNFESWAKNSGYLDGFSLDRIDVDGDYTPNNCRWVEIKEQQRNKRNNINIEINGIIHILAEWSRILGVNEETLRYHVKKYGNLDRYISQIYTGGYNG